MILIVDDDEATRDSLKVLLECEGFETRDFASARDLLECHWPGDRDCLILDLHMPGIGGLDLLELLRRDGNNVPVVIITGALGPDHRRRARRLGALALLEKPYAVSELVGLVRQALAMAAAAVRGTAANNPIGCCEI